MFRYFSSAVPLCMPINPFRASPIFGQVQKFFFFRKFIASSVFMLERYIKRPFFFREGFEVFFSYKHEKIKNQARIEIVRQMTLTLTFIQNVIYVQWTRKG